MDFIPFDLFERPGELSVLVGDTRQFASEIIKQHHYTHSVPSGKSHYMKFKDAIVVWSLPANNNIAKFVLGWKGNDPGADGTLGTRRPRSKSLTQAISHATKRLVELESPDAVISYADPNAGHSGGVYRAASWISHGQSTENRAYRGPNGEIVARRAFHSGRKFLLKRDIEALGYVQLDLPGKHRFVRFLSKRARMQNDRRT